MTKQRPLLPTYDRRGNPEWKSVMTAPDASVGVLCMVSDRVIPVIFVPGVMGSNLKGVGASKKVQWRLDSGATAGDWALGERGAKFRKKHLTPSTMVVDDEGMLPTDTAQHAEELKRRGWGEISALSYSDFLSWLENALNDYDTANGGLRDQLIGVALSAEKGETALLRDDVALSYKYRFPVHACGYNWLDSNDVAARRLQARIHDIINRYRSEKMKCEKVILVTHSMGGLVARHCSEVLGMRDHILGIVHGVMPALGAAAVYRRMKAGTESAGGLKGVIVSSILGNDAGEMTAVLAGAPGPLQLLPTSEYGNGWLRLKDGTTEIRLPRNGDPYSEIYTVRDKWWGLCEDHLINPLNEEQNPVRRMALMDRDWTAFVDLIFEKVRPFHAAIQGKYHPNTHAFYGSDDKQKAFGTITWRRVGTGSAPTNPYDGSRDNPNQTGTLRTVKAPVTNRPNILLTRHYALGPQDEAGDGTVPHRSGVAPAAHAHVKSVLRICAGHEPAFKESLAARQFTLRAIVQIAGDIIKTSLHYDD